MLPTLHEPALRRKNDTDDPSAFLFVQERVSSTSSTARDPNGQRLIKSNKKVLNRHVQRISFQRRQQATQKPVSKPPLGWRYNPPSPVSHSPEITSNRRGSLGTSDSEDSDQNKPFLPTTKHGRRLVYQSKRTQRHQSNALARPPSSSVDPFTTTRTKIEPWTLAVLDYYMNFWGLAPFKIEVAAQPAGATLFHSALDEMVHGYLKSPMHMYAIATAVSSRMHYITGDKSLSRYGASPRPEWFLNKALRALREYFGELKDGDVVDTQTILDVYCLHSAEMFAQHYEASRIHLRIFNQLSSRLEGSETLKRYCRRIQSMGDAWLAIETLSPPVFLVPCPPLPLSRVRQIHATMDNATRSIAISFRAHAELFSQGMNAVLPHLIEWWQIANYVWSCLAPLPADTLWLSKRTSFLVCELLELPSPPAFSLSLLPLMSVEGLQALPHQQKEECVRIAMVIWISFILSHLAAPRSGRLNIPRLKTALLNVDAIARALDGDEAWTSVWYPCEELHIWVLFTGAYVAEQSGVEQVWFMEELLIAVRNQGIRNWRTLERLLRGYFYLERLEAVILEKVGQLMAGRA